MGSRKRGADAVAALRATIAEMGDGLELDEHDEEQLKAIARAYNRAADLDKDAARLRREGGSMRLISELAAESRLQEVAAGRWASEMVAKAEKAGGVAPGKSWAHVKAARARWDGVAAGKAG